jgi:hypothetical protein
MKRYAIKKKSIPQKGGSGSFPIISNNAAGIDIGGLGGFYRRIRSRLGSPKAITATAHKLARIFYRMWTTRQAYADLGSDYYENRYKERVLRNITKRARALGYDAVLQPIGQRVA